MLEAGNMAKGFSGSDRLEVLGQEINCLISLGKKRICRKDS